VSDQSQVELRLIGHFTRDATLIRVYAEGVTVGDTFYYTGDIHKTTAEAARVARKTAKAINFGFNYGMRPLKYCRTTKLFNSEGGYDIEAATAYRKAYFETYPGILSYSDDLLTAFQEGQRAFRTIVGRFRNFDQPKDEEYITGGKILNSKVQGSSADILKINIWILRKLVKPVIPSLELIIQVHDELVYQVDEKDSEKACALIKYVMERDWVGCRLPILASAKVCDSWAAKDNDDSPEFGKFYAQIDGKEDLLFNESNWGTYLQADKENRITKQSAVAMLSPDQTEFCESIVGVDLREILPDAD
jgi:DNA polymerase-1